MRQEFTIPGRLSGQNEYSRSNRFNKERGNWAKKANERLVRQAIMAARLNPMKTPVRITAHWYEGLNPGKKVFRPRDRDNIRSGMKFIQDALVEAKVIDNDSFHKVDPHDTYHLDRENPRIVVEIEEIDGTE